MITSVFEHIQIGYDLFSLRSISLIFSKSIRVLAFLT